MINYLKQIDEMNIAQIELVLWHVGNRLTYISNGAAIEKMNDLSESLSRAERLIEDAAYIINNIKRVGK